MSDRNIPKEERCGERFYTPEDTGDQLYLCALSPGHSGPHGQIELLASNPKLLRSWRREISEAIEESRRGMQVGMATVRLPRSLVENMVKIIDGMPADEPKPALMACEACGAIEAGKDTCRCPDKHMVDAQALIRSLWDLAYGDHAPVKPHAFIPCNPNFDPRAYADGLCHECNQTAHSHIHAVETTACICRPVGAGDGDTYVVDPRCRAHK